ncbi:MAG TPA: glycosyl hydrolase family 65 protein [Puia sp.]|nr:glycosyl hydrolase family 65 protein [Puia sp.]
MHRGIKYMVLALFSCFAVPGQIYPQTIVLNRESFKHYIDSFNVNDQELYPQYIPNNQSWKFLSENIPFLDCPDKMMEQTYYFRWWTYRKHIRKTPEGFVILEFLPDVGWAGKYNTINCAAALHVYEGRWLHDQTYVQDYIRFWYKGGGDMRAYSCWMADALLNQGFVTNDVSQAERLLPDLVNNFTVWEKENSDSTGLYFQIDGKDGMEVSVCGENSEKPAYRPTINAYQYGDARAISKIAALSHKENIAAAFDEKADQLREKLQEKLWDPHAGFFKVMPRGAGAPRSTARELLDYTPWFFNMTGASDQKAWKFLMNKTYVFAPFGLTTVEQDHPGFTISYEGHECQWNGPSWPFASSVTLTGLANTLNNCQQSYISKKDYFTLLKQYANAHQLRREDGKMVPWIDENLNPYTGDWIARTRLKTWANGTWSAEKGGVERGKDYNHSSFCDLIISGLIGIRPQLGNQLVINPLVPENTWDYFCLDRILYHGHVLTVVYDKTGKRYKKGKGFFILIDGRKVATCPKLQKISLAINSNY